MCHKSIGQFVNKHGDLYLIPSTTERAKCGGVYCAGEEEAARSLKVRWSTSLAKLVSSRPVRGPVVREKVGGARGVTPETGVTTCTHTHTEQGVQGGWVRWVFVAFDFRCVACESISPLLLVLVVGSYSRDSSGASPGKHPPEFGGCPKGRSRGVSPGW